jgi:crossover junction endodeoxyribonuclease RuvC
VLVIGVDPGTKITGFGIITKNRNNFSYVSSGILNLTQFNNIQDKLKALYNCFSEILSQYHPDSVAIEDIFYSKNIKSTIKLGYIKGTVFLAAIHKGIKVVEYAPTKVKSSVTGNGRATKDSVRRMISCLIDNVPDIKYNDESDALAIAYCHLIEENFKSFLKG